MAAGKRMEAEGGREREISCHSDRRGAPRKRQMARRGRAEARQVS